MKAKMEKMFIIHDESGEFAHRIRRNPDAPDFGIQIEFSDDFKTWRDEHVFSPSAARLIAQALNQLADEMGENHK